MLNTTFLDIANKLEPTLKEKKINVNGSNRVLKKGDEVIFDFKDHYVGYVDIDLTSVGHHFDAPLLLQINFAEIKEEFAMDADSYKGWISEGWIQEERIHIDTFPYTLTLNRRYAFRYIKVKVLAASDNYSVKINRITCTTVSSADLSKVKRIKMNDIDTKIDAVGVRTLHNCMQSVFEDGPKRDRRLWLGDLRLQALANYETFKNNDLVKRCLYLFAGTTLPKGLVASNVFIEPEVECDFQSMFDYTLFFINTLWEYYEKTNDLKTLKDLEPVCLKQHSLMKKMFVNDVLDVSKTERTFIDWNLILDKKVAGQGVYIAALKDLIKIEEVLGKDIKNLEKEIDKKTKAIIADSYDEDKGLFISNGQISYASQIWMVLSGVVNGDDASNLMKTIDAYDAVSISSPYLKHYYIEALIKAGLKDKAYEEIHSYWGKMIEMGADTYWELFNPEDINYSPYGGLLVHSFCHAWSCTPTYFLRKYFY